MKNGKLKSVISLALAFTMLLCCTATAFAADIDFGNVVDGATQGSHGYDYDSGNGNTITTSDANNSITGDGSSYGLHFTNNTGTTTLTVNGDTTVGKGIEADGDLTITGNTNDTTPNDTLTVTGDNSPGIEVGGDLTIDGGVTVNATGNGVPQGEDAPSPGVSADDVYIKSGSTLTATGAGAGPSIPSLGIDAHHVYVDGVETTLPASNSQTNGNGTVTLTSTGTPGDNNSNNNDNYGITTRIITLTDSQIDAMERLAKLFDAYDKAYRAWEDAGVGNANRPALLSAMIDALNKLLDALFELNGDADMLAALSGKFNDSLSAYRKDESSVSESGRENWRAGVAHLLDPRLDLNTTAYNERRLKAQEATINISDYMRDGDAPYYAAGYAYDAMLALRDLLSMFGY